MENDNEERIDFSFLEIIDVQIYFADINILLLSGRHIDNRDYSLFNILLEYEKQFSAFYENLYKLRLVSDIYDGCQYYYLDFFETGRGELSDQKRNKELTPAQTLIGLMLLDMYYQKYFNDVKMVQWDEIRSQILESDHQESYKRILFNSVRDSYDEKEWNNVESMFNRTIDSFEKLGWVEKTSIKSESLMFEIRPAIHRLSKVYQWELKNFEVFSQQFANEK